MKKIITVLLLQSLCMTLMAGNIGKLYRSAITDKGTLYFLNEQQMPKSKESKAKKPLRFDVTYLTSSDTVSIKMTVISTSAVKENHVTIVNADGQKTVIPTVIIYRDVTKKGYVNRIEMKILRADYRNIYKAPLPYTLDFGSQNSFRFTDKQWMKHQQEVNTIWEVIDLAQ